MTLAGKVAVVTGGASGIGAATAKALAAAGVKVIIADIRRDAAEAVATQIMQTEAAVLDVTRPESWQSLVEWVLSQHKRWDILINAAGIGHTGRTPANVAEATLEAWRSVFATNVEGTLLGCQAAIREMTGGAIVNIASTAAFSPSPTLAAYGAAKAAIVQLTKSVAVWGAGLERPIRCNAVAPGMTDTPLVAGLESSARALWEEQIPMHRFAEPDEIAQTILFLAGPASSYMTGTCVQVDGGFLNRHAISLGRTP